MKKFKLGFSLAEVLIALGIVSVIATIGFTATKHSIDRAYDAYIYTGYQGITTAIAEANARGNEIDKNLDTFWREVSDVLNLEDSDAPGFSIAPNGVEYRVTQVGTIDDDSVTPPRTKYYYTIEMKVPCKKQIDNATNQVKTKETICLGYMPQDRYGILVPFNAAYGCTSTINLLERIDLLPFYVDDGRAGRVVSGSYNRKIYRNAKDAICEAYGGSIRLFNTPIANCGIAEKNPALGSVRVENPRKAH